MARKIKTKALAAEEAAVAIWQLALWRLQEEWLYQLQSEKVDLALLVVTAALEGQLLSAPM